MADAPEQPTQPNADGDYIEKCSICGARNFKNPNRTYTEAHRAREHRVHDRIVALEARVAALESRLGP